MSYKFNLSFNVVEKVRGKNIGNLDYSDYVDAHYGTLGKTELIKKIFEFVQETRTDIADVFNLLENPNYFLIGRTQHSDIEINFGSVEEPMVKYLTFDILSFQYNDMRKWYNWYGRSAIERKLRKTEDDDRLAVLSEIMSDVTNDILRTGVEVENLFSKWAEADTDEKRINLIVELGQKLKAAKDAEFEPNCVPELIFIHFMADKPVNELSYSEAEPLKQYIFGPAMFKLSDLSVVEWLVKNTFFE